MEEPIESVFDGLLTPAENIERDERWLGDEGPGVRTAVLSSAAVSLGVGVRQDQPLAERARRLGLPVLRRSSGGTAVLHEPGDIAWSLRVPTDHPLAGRRFTQAYGPIGEGVVRFLARRSVEARWVGPLALSDELCLLGSRGKVLAVGGRVLGGAAQRRTARSLLHHGVVGRSLHWGRLAQLSQLPDAVLRGHLTSLEELGVIEAPATLAEALAAETGRVLLDASRVHG